MANPDPNLTILRKSYWIEDLFDLETDVYDVLNSTKQLDADSRIIITVEIQQPE